MLLSLISAACIIAVLTLLWKENRVYRFAEHLLVGLTVGFGFAATWFEYLKPNWWDPWKESKTVGEFLFGFMALLLGLCWYGMYFKKTEWLMRVALGIVSGAAAGQAIRNQFTQTMPVLTDSFRSPIVISDGTLQSSESINNTIFLLVLLPTLCYFFFSFDFKSKGMLMVSRIGRFWLMVGFGAYFGNTLMTRLSALIERVWFLMDEVVRKLL